MRANPILPAIILVTVAVAMYAQQPPANTAAREQEFTDSVVCAWPNDPAHNPVVDCEKGLVVSGDDSSSVYIRNVGGDVVSMSVRTAQFVGGTEGDSPSGHWEFTDVQAPAGEIQLDVYKTRWFFPAYRTKPRQVQRLFTGEVAKPDTDDMPWIVIQSAHPLSITVTPTGGQAVTFHVNTRFQRWHLDTGGFYAYSWARNEEIVTTPLNGDANKPKTQVLQKRGGDRIGPATGITFFFHPSNYPDFGWEFGTAVNGNNPNSYFVGVGGRLRTFGDNTLLTLAAGVSRISVRRYPDLTANTAYDSTDPRLTGRQGYVTSPYISIGLGVNFGGNGGNDSVARSNH